MLPATLVSIVIAALAMACGSEQVGPREVGSTAGLRELGPRYGISVALPSDWRGRLNRGALQAATFPLPAQASGWIYETARKNLAEDDIVVTLFETAPENESPPANLDEYPPLTGALAFEAADFDSWDGGTEDSRLTGHGYGRRAFELSGRLFVVLVETGSWPPPRPMLAGLNELLGSLDVEFGDFYPGTVEAARFPERPGWYVGTSGPDEVDADGEFVTSWAATIRWADEWNALPASRTLGKLPRDGIAMWLLVERDNRRPPGPEGDRTAPRRDPPFRLSQFERRDGWEGQVRDLPEYVLWGTVYGQYRIDLRIYFGRQDATRELRAEAQEVLDSLELPDWGPFELQP